MVNTQSPLDKSKKGHNWAIGQTVKMSACHAVRSGFNSRIARETLKHNVLSALQRVCAESTVSTNCMNDVRYCSLIRLEWPRVRGRFKVQILSIPQ